jgi:nitrite reductase (NADH) small subunit
MSYWIEIGSVEDIPKLGSRVVKTIGGDIAVFRTSDDSVFALQDSCPHKNGPLSQGIVHGHVVTCPLHNWNIDLTSGQAQGPDEGCAGKHDVKVEEGMVFLLMES